MIEFSIPTKTELHGNKFGLGKIKSIIKLSYKLNTDFIKGSEFVIKDPFDVLMFNIGFSRKPAVFFTSSMIGVRPTMKYSDIKHQVKTHLNKDNMLEFDYGEYPQSLIDENKSNELENEYNNCLNNQDFHKMVIDNSYTFSYYYYDKYGKLVNTNLPTINYNDNNYVRAPKRVKNEIVYKWYKIEPIKWLVDSKHNYVISKNILFNYPIDIKLTQLNRDFVKFKKTPLYNFLNGEFKKEILPHSKEKTYSKKEIVDNSLKKIRNLMTKYTGYINIDKIINDLLIDYENKINNYQENNTSTITLTNESLDSIYIELILKLEILFYNLSIFISNYDEILNYYNAVTMSDSDNKDSVIFELLTRLENKIIPGTKYDFALIEFDDLVIKEKNNISIIIENMKRIDFNKKYEPINISYMKGEFLTKIDNYTKKIHNINSYYDYLNILNLINSNEKYDGNNELYKFLLNLKKLSLNDYNLRNNFNIIIQNEIMKVSELINKFDLNTNINNIIDINVLKNELKNKLLELFNITEKNQVEVNCIK